MVHTLGGWGMGDSDRRTSQYAHVAHINGKQQQYGAAPAFDDERDDDDFGSDLLDTEFHGDEDDSRLLDKSCYGSDHDEMLHEGFGRETEDETDMAPGHYDGVALSEEGYGSHREESFLHSAPLPAQSEHEVDLHPLNNQVRFFLSFFQFLYPLSS